MWWNAALPSWNLSVLFHHRGSLDPSDSVLSTTSRVWFHKSSNASVLLSFLMQVDVIWQSLIPSPEETFGSCNLLLRISVFSKILCASSRQKRKSCSWIIRSKPLTNDLIFESEVFSEISFSAKGKISSCLSSPSSARNFIVNLVGHNGRILFCEHFTCNATVFTISHLWDESLKKTTNSCIKLKKSRNCEMEDIVSWIAKLRECI